jgi:hypothetical protein
MLDATIVAARGHSAYVQPGRVWHEVLRHAGRSWHSVTLHLMGSEVDDQAEAGALQITAHDDRRKIPGRGENAVGLRRYLFSRAVRGRAREATRSRRHGATVPD